jgi:segregation and condensation protein A
MPQITLPVFEGPLELLLHLIERDDLDITAVSLVAVTDQYLKKVHERETVDPGALAEFVSIGAKLILLKSRALLPRVEVADEEPEDDVGAELVELLFEYQRFKAAADILESRQDSGFRLFGRDAVAPDMPITSGLEGIAVDSLYTIMLDVLSRKEDEPEGVVERQTVTLRERIGDFRERLRGKGRFSLRSVLETCQTRLEVIICFLAILELLKGGECSAVQQDSFGEIEVAPATPSAS